MIRRSPRRFHNRHKVLTPTVAIVKSPTHLQLTTAPSERPDNASQVHQLVVNGSCLSSLQKPIQRKTVRAVKKMRGESRRTCRDCVTSPFSNVMKREAKRAAVTRQSRARRVRYARGTVATPSAAGTIRIATYGTCSYVLRRVISIYKRRKRQRNELCNVFEIKLAVITEDKAGKSNEEFCKGWMDVDEILTLDVF